MRLFGVGEFGARFPNAMCGILTLMLLYEIGRRLRSATFGRWWALVHAGSLLPFFYFKTAIIDPWFNLFMFAAVVAMAVAADRHHRSGATAAASVAGGCVGLAMLTKGPVGLLLPGLTALVVWTWRRFRPRIRLADLAVALLTMLLVSSAWYLPETVRHGAWFLREFLQYQVDLLAEPIAGHRGPIYFHLVVLLIGCWPASVLALRALRPPANDPLQFSRWMISLLAVVLVVFSVVTTKIVHYSSLAYFPLSYLAATRLMALRTGQTRLDRASLAGLLTIAVLLAVALTALPWAGRHAELLIPHVKDRFAAANLGAKVPWQPYEVLLGPLWLLAVIAAGWALRKGRIVAGAWTLLGSTALMLLAATATLVPKLHEHIQGAPVRFYRSLQDRDVYVEVLGFKSYAHLFYARTRPPSTPDVDTLLHGTLDRPAYFVSRIDKAAPYRAMETLREIGEENGYVFFERLP
jgi:hypothetical protein